MTPFLRKKNVHSLLGLVSPVTQSRPESSHAPSGSHNAPEHNDQSDESRASDNAGQFTLFDDSPFSIRFF